MTTKARDQPDGSPCCLALLHLPNFIVPTIRRALFKGARASSSLVLWLLNCHLLTRTLRRGGRLLYLSPFFLNPSALYFLGAQFHFHWGRNCFKIVFNRNPSPGNHALNRRNRYPHGHRKVPQMRKLHKPSSTLTLFSNTRDIGRERISN